MGPMTGRAAGTCAGNQVPGPGNRGGGGRCGLGFGRGRGGGMGRGLGAGLGARNRFAAGGRGGGVGALPLDMPPEQELAGLKQQAEQAGQMLETIHQRIQELETKPAE